MTGVEITYYFICKRKLWYFSNHIEKEHDDENVKIGKLISENTYKRNKHEIAFDSIKIDFFDPVKNILHEIKKSNKMEEAHIWQVKFYLYTLKLNGFKDVTGMLDYPELKKRKMIKLESEDEEKILRINEEVNKIKAMMLPPKVIDKAICKKCSYYELCYI